MTLVIKRWYHSFFYNLFQRGPETISTRQVTYLPKSIRSKIRRIQASSFTSSSTCPYTARQTLPHQPRKPLAVDTQKLSIYFKRKKVREQVMAPEPGLAAIPNNSGCFRRPLGTNTAGQIQSLTAGFSTCTVQIVAEHMGTGCLETQCSGPLLQRYADTQQKKKQFSRKNCTPSSWHIEQETGKAEARGFHPISSISSPNLSLSCSPQLRQGDERCRTPAQQLPPAEAAAERPEGQDCPPPASYKESAAPTAHKLLKTKKAKPRSQD